MLQEQALSRTITGAGKCRGTPDNWSEGPRLLQELQWPFLAWKW